MSAPFIILLIFVILVVLDAFIYHHPTARTSISNLIPPQGSTKFSRWVRGLIRYIRLFGGFCSGSTHHAASNWLLGIGFFVEYSVIGHVFHGDINPFTNDNDSVLRSVVEWLPKIILLPLFFHQFLIFRNFTIPTSHTAAGETLHGLGATSHDWNGWRTIRSILEFLIYLAFGVITGEAGYLYAIGHLSETHTAPFTSIQGLTGHSSNLKMALETLFILGAILVCILVIIWDLLVWLSIKWGRSEADKERYYISLGGPKLLWWFLALDVFSLGIWLAIASVIWPTMYLTGNARDRMSWAIIGVALSALFYCTIALCRFILGCADLGARQSFSKAKNIPL